MIMHQDDINLQDTCAEFALSSEEAKIHVSLVCFLEICCLEEPTTVSAHWVLRLSSRRRADKQSMLDADIKDETSSREENTRMPQGQPDSTDNNAVREGCLLRW